MPPLQNRFDTEKQAKEFDYQSECHCSKTTRRSIPVEFSLTTSQNATAPKQQKGGTSADFKSLPAKEQQAAFNEELKALPKNLPTRVSSKRQIPVGGIFGKTKATLEITNMESRLVPELTLQEKQIFAGAGASTLYRKRDILTEAYGGDSEKWTHNAGEAWAFDPIDGRIRLAEFHWAEEPSVGIREFRFKRWRD